jgi:hypothetical protein
MREDQGKVLKGFTSQDPLCAPSFNSLAGKGLLRNGFPVWQSDTTLAGLNSWALPTQPELAHRQNSAEPRGLRIDTIKKGPQDGRMGGPARTEETERRPRGGHSVHTPRRWAWT